MAVVIRPHKELTVQKLVGVMDSLRAAKIAKVGIVTEQPGGKPSPDGQPGALMDAERNSGATWRSSRWGTCW